MNERRLAGEKIKFASRRKLRKVMTAQFKEAFGSECIGLACVDEWEELVFCTKCSGWIIETQFDIGRRESQIGYNHCITTRRIFEPDEAQPSPIRCMGYFLSFNSRLGISSQSEWPYLMDEDIEPTCAVVIEHCRRFVDAAPQLLEGLELDKLTV